MNSHGSTGSSLVAVREPGDEGLSHFSVPIRRDVFCSVSVLYPLLLLCALPSLVYSLTQK